MKKMMTVLMTIAALAFVAPLAHSASNSGDTSGYKYGKKFTPISESAAVEQKGEANLNSYRYGKKYFPVAQPKAEEQEKVSYRYGVKYQQIA